MDHRLIEGLMEVIAPLVKEYVENQVAPLRAELAEYKARAPEKGEPGKDADPTAVAALVLEQVRPDIDAAVKGAVEAIPPVQVDPELVRLAAGDLVHKAVPPPEHVASMVEQAVEARMALIEPPRDGKDADMGAVFAEIERRFQEIPTPRDGRDSDPAEVERMVDAAVTKAMAAVPTPKDGEPGKDADPEHVEMLVRLVVGEEIGKIEPPRDGKDADMDAVAEIVRARVDEAVAAIRVPEDGKSVTVDDVRPVLEELVAAIPPAPAGKDADVDAVLRAVDERVSEKVAEAVSSIRVPEDGKSVTVEDVRPMIEEVVKAAVAEIPVPVNGKDADPAEVAALILDDVVKLIPPGRDGTSVTVEDVAPMLEQLVEKRVSAIPPAPAGKDGRD
ncbi:MAG: hypothetical protein MK097_03150, partial [Dechloromonas sp.]|nr:hypothetical protein [Dechloromonas sp.]